MEASQNGTKITPGFAKYRIIAELGRGGMAVVHLAVAQGPAGFNKLVVLKRTYPQFATDPEFTTRFFDEARLAARFRHPNVVQTNDMGEGEDGQYFMAMEYLEGQPLDRIRYRLDRKGGMPIMMQLRVLADVLSGLHYAHELVDYDGSPLGVVHRDVNPANVFLTYDGTAKIVDFGIAKARDSVARTKSGVVLGKLAYMAPEQVRCEEPDRRVDIFAVGVMLWEAATGTRMWQGASRGTIVRRLLTQDIPAPRSVNPDIPDQLDVIIRKAMAPDRAERYATAAELQADILRLLAEMGDGGNIREIGQFVASQFEDDRSLIQALVEEHLLLDKLPKSPPSSSKSKLLQGIASPTPAPAIPSPGASPSERFPSSLSTTPLKRFRSDASCTG